MAYPDSLPVPQTSTVTKAERRSLSNETRPRDALPTQLDGHEFEELTWPPMRAEQMAVFRAWWQNELIYGGAWFTATWPLPRGMVEAVRKFVGTYHREYIPGGFWRVTALCEVRGSGVFPNDVGDAEFFTSELYPYGMANEAIDVLAPTLIDGVLSPIIIEYTNWRDVAPEMIDVPAPLLIDGTLLVPVVEYTNWRDVAPEMIDVLAPTLINGTLVVPVIEYTNWRDVAPEMIDVLAPTLINGTLAVPILSYTNWRDVAPEMIDVLAPALINGTLVVVVINYVNWRDVAPEMIDVLAPTLIDGTLV